MCVSVLALIESKHQDSIRKVRISGGSEDILAGPYNVKGLFEGSELILMSGLGLV